MDGVYPVSITVDASGKQVPGIVFRDPKVAAAESYAFPRGYVIGFKDGVSFDPTNDDGVLPYRERTSPDEDLGLTWQIPK
jgi:hypothetical protein